MTQRHHSSYSTTITWKVVSTPSSITVVPSARDGAISLAITILGALGMYWVANHLVEIESKMGLILCNLVCLSTPVLLASMMGSLWFTRDKRPFILVDFQAMTVSLPRSGVNFPVDDPSATFVYDIISPRSDDTVCEFNLVFEPGETEKVYPILRNLGKSSVYERLGQTLKAAGLRYEKRISTL
jgi:hypothetical protein